MLDMQPAFIRRLDTEGVVSRPALPAVSVVTAVSSSTTSRPSPALMSEGMTLAGAQRIIELENEIAELRRQLALQPIPTTAR